MATKDKKHIISFSGPRSTEKKKRANETFYTKARKHIVKGERGGDPELSLKVDSVVYGK